MKESQLKQLIKECLKELFLETYTTRITDPQTDQPIEVEVEYNYFGGHTGMRTGMDRFAEPDEAATVEITHIINAETGQEIDERLLGPDAILNLESEILEHHEGMD